MVRGTVFLLVELTVLFFGVAFLVQLSQRRLGDERLRVWMGGRPVVAALKGIAVGFVTPFCTFSAIPLLLGLRQAGVTPAGYVAFITAAPVLDPVLFGALVVIVGLKVAIVYVIVAFSAAMALALFSESIDIAKYLKPVPTRVRVGTPEVPVESPACSPCGDDSAWQGWQVEAGRAARSAQGLLLSMAPLLILGVGIGLLIEVAISPETASRVTGDNATFAIPIAAALGTPMYFSTELFVPIADSLSTAGVGVGAIVALTIAGAGANVPEFVLLSRIADKRVIVVFFGYVFAIAAVGGWLAQLVSS